MSFYSRRNYCSTPHRLRVPMLRMPFRSVTKAKHSFAKKKTQLQQLENLLKTRHFSRHDDCAGIENNCENKYKHFDCDFFSCWSNLRRSPPKQSLHHRNPYTNLAAAYCVIADHRKQFIRFACGRLNSLSQYNSIWARDEFH